MMSELKETYPHSTFTVNFLERTPKRMVADELYEALVIARDEVFDHINNLCDGKYTPSKDRSTTHSEGVLVKIDAALKAARGET